MKYLKASLAVAFVLAIAILTNYMTKDLGKYSPHVRLITEEGYSICSGTVVSDRYVVTAAHCLTTHIDIPSYNQCMIETEGLPLPPEARKDLCGKNTTVYDKSSIVADGNYKKTVTAKVVAFSVRDDYMVLEGDFSTFSQIHLNTKYNASNGEKLESYGYPRRGKLNISKGTAEGYFDFKIMSTSMNIVPGMSGGALLNSSGDLIGINHGVLENMQLFIQTLNLESATGVGDL